MTTVTIKIDEISAAITAMEDLSSEVTSQAGVARSASPIGLPSLSESTLGKKTRWLDDHLEDLTTRRDLAILLDTEGTGSASYTVTSDTLSNVKEMLGQELAAAAGSIDATSDQDQLDHLAGLLETWKDDPDVMSAMFTELGPDGTVGFMANISSAMGYGGVGDPDVYTSLAEDFRSGLATASNAPGFPAEEFGQEIVRFSVAPLLTDEEQQAFAEEFGMGMNGANILTFLMGDTTYSDDFLLGAANQLDDFERMTAGGPMDATVWYGHNGHGPLPTGNETGWYDDPMAMIMHNLGENPEAGLTFFTQPTEDGWSRESYYFEQRDWRADGFAGISHAIEGIGTNEANLENDPEATTRLVSSFFDQIPENEHFNPENAVGGSPHLAELMKFYMPAVDNALQYGDEEGDPLSTRLEVEHLGILEWSPVLFKEDLDALMQVAMSTQDGTESIAEGIAAYQQTQVNNIAAELALDPDNPSLRAELLDTLEGRASLQGFAEYSVGRVEIDGAASRDAQRQAFLDALSSATSLVPLPGADAVGDWGSKIIKHGFSESVRLGKGEVADSWTNEAASVADDATVRAEESLRQLKLETFYSLVDAGVIAGDDVPDRWVDDRGNLIDPSDIPAGELPSYTQSAMNAVDSYISDGNLAGPYKDQFTQYYAEASQ